MANCNEHLFLNSYILFCHVFEDFELDSCVKMSSTFFPL